MKKAMLVVSFGTTYLEAKKNSIDATVNYIKDRFPNYDIFQAYTSVIIRKKLSKIGIDIDDVKSALEKLQKQGYKDIIIVSLHLIAGHEYEKKILSIVDKHRESFDNISITRPMLYDEKDYAKMADILEKIYLDTEKPIVLMGHGTDHKNDIVYENLQRELDKKNKDKYHIATVEGSIGINDIIKKLSYKGIKKVSLTPFMLVCGDHANNDMAGDEEDSWINILKKESIKSDLILKGLGEYKEIREYFVEKILEKIS